jgi:6-phospho-beta-glucosidase
MRKVTIIGGGGVRTPLLIHALARARGLEVSEVALSDLARERAETNSKLGREILRTSERSFELHVASTVEEAAMGADFVLNSIRVGGIAARARDERIAIEHGLAGQETTGPAGAAMALRTIPVTLQQARLVETVAPSAWFINFTNPAGLITQALQQQTALKVIGICDTPIELFHRIAEVLGEPVTDFGFHYAGLNHLGWVRAVELRGEDVTELLLSRPDLLQRLYPAGLFDPELVRTLRLIPTEYLFFYYSQRKACENQRRVGASRGEEIERLNGNLFEQLRSSGGADALAAYRRYLLQRNASYMKLEGNAESAFAIAEEDYDPFETATGYHRIALDVMSGLVSESTRELVLNVKNAGAIEDLESNDVVEVPCDIDRNGARPRRTGRLPYSVRGLVQSVKAYERTTIEAALSGSARLAQLAMLEYPIIGQWELARDLLQRLVRDDMENLGFLR